MPCDIKIVVMAYGLWFVGQLLYQAAYILRARRMQTRKAYEALQAIETQFQGHFQPTTRNEIAIAHGIFQPMVVEPFCRLQGKQASSNHVLRQIHYFCCSSLFDDLIDTSSLTEPQLHHLMFGAGAQAHDPFEVRVLVHFHESLRDFVRRKDAYKQVTTDLFQAQIKSRYQQDPHLDRSELEAITFTKGGLSTLLCAFYMDEDPSEPAFTCWRIIGRVIQLIDDMFDLEQDLMEGSQTLVTRMLRVEELETVFLEQVTAMKRAISQLPVSSARKQRFSLSMAGIYAFGMVGLNHFSRLQGTHETLPSWNSLGHADFVIDMEKPANIWRWIRYVYSYTRISS